MESHQETHQRTLRDKWNMALCDPATFPVYLWAYREDFFFFSRELWADSDVAARCRSVQTVFS